MKPAQANCKRCGELFVFFQITTPRVFCGKCVELERLDLLEFTKAQRRKVRILRAHQQARAA